jgi:hypothetical protein
LRADGILDANDGKVDGVVESIFDEIDGGVVAKSFSVG